MNPRIFFSLPAILLALVSSNGSAIQESRVVSRESTNRFERVKFLDSRNNVTTAIVRYPKDATSEGVFFIGSNSPDPQLEIQDAIAAISRSHSPGRIVLDGGVYEFERPVNGAYLRVENCVDLKILGNGSQMVFPDPETGILVLDSRRVQICDLDLRYLTRVATEAVVVEGANGGKAVQISEGYLNDMNESAHYRSCESLYKRGDSMPFDNRAMVRWLQGDSVDTLEFDGDGLFLPSSSKVLKDFDVGDVVTAKHFEYRANALTILRCDDFSLMRCHASNVPGMFVFLRAIGTGVLLDSNELQVDPHDELSKVSASNDGFHLNSSGKNVIIRNNRLSQMGDDGVNLHHEYWNILSVSESSAVLQLSNPFTDTLDLRPGSKVEFLSSGLKYKLEALVQSRDFLLPNNTFLVRFKRPLIDVSGGDIANVHQWQPRNFVIENNHFSNFWGRGMLIQSRDGLVEGNEIRNLAGAGISVTTDYRLFQESGPVRNVVINNNLIVNSAKSRLSQARNTLELGAISVSSKSEFSDPDSPRGFSENYLHRRIVIENNRIRNCGGPAIFLSSVRNVEARDNVITNAVRIQFNFNRPGRLSGIRNTVYKAPIANFHSKDSRIYDNRIE